MEKNPAQDTERYQNEAEFFDREVDELLRNERRLRFNNSLNYEEYFAYYVTYSVVRDFFGSIKDKKILDYACGSGWISIYFARSGADCYGFDISPKSIEAATKMAQVNNVADRCHFQVTTAENLSYPDGTFDFVFGNAALHHTDLQKSPAEIARVLKPGGKAAFIDDLRYHPAMWLYRKFTSDKHTKYETPMLYRDIEKFNPHFSKVTFESYDFFNLFPRNRTLSKISRSLDKMTLAIFPFLKYFCRHLVIKLEK